MARGLSECAGLGHCLSCQLCQPCNAFFSRPFHRSAHDLSFRWFCLCSTSVRCDAPCQASKASFCFGARLSWPRSLPVCSPISPKPYLLCSKRRWPCRRSVPGGGEVLSPSALQMHQALTFSPSSGWASACSTSAVEAESSRAGRESSRRMEAIWPLVICVVFF